MGEARKTLNNIAARYAVFAVVVTGFQFFLAALIKKLVPSDDLNDHRVLFQYMLTIVTIYMVGFPFLLFLNKNQPEWHRGKRKLGMGNFLAGICMCYALIYPLSVAGNMLNFILSGSTSSAVEEMLLSDESGILGIIVAGICAPVFEELMFRKILIDHLAHRGKFLAILVSGISFGLFHGNFSQFFFAAGLGMFFAYIYITTGDIRYTIGYHMVVNLSSSVIGVRVAKSYMKNIMDYPKNMASIMPLFVYALVLMGVALTGFVLGILHIVKSTGVEKISEGETVYEDAPPVRGGQAFQVFFSSWGNWLFILICAWKFIRYYMGS